MTSEPTPRQRPDGDAPAEDHDPIRIIGLLVLAVTGCYLLWRLSILGHGWTLALSVPLVVAELWAGIQLAALVYSSIPSGPDNRAPLDRRTSGRPGSPPIGTEERGHGAEILVAAVDADRAEIERTLVGCQLVAGRPPITILDGPERDDVARLAATFGADYRSGHRDDLQAVGTGLADSSADLVLWIEGGQIPMPNLLSGTRSRFADPDVAVVQVGVGLLNPDSLGHQQRGRDETALTRDVIGPAMARRGLAPWFGPGSVIRRTAIDSVGGLCGAGRRGVGPVLVDLHRHGWRSDFDSRPLIRATAADTLSDYLRQRRRLAAETLAVLLTNRNPLTCRGLPATARLTHLSTMVGFGTGVRQLIVVAVIVATLLTGRLPFDTGIVNFAAAWTVAAAAGFVARRRLARGTMAMGDWVRHGWRTAGADLAGFFDVVRHRLPRHRRHGPREDGLRTLGRLRLLSAAVVALDVALLIRSITIFDSDLLPPFTTTGRLLAVGAGLATLIPMIDVLQMTVRRRQRRSSYRLPVEVPITWEDSTGLTIGLTAEGAGAVLNRAADVGTRGRFSIDLPRIDGTSHAVGGQAEVRSVVERPDGRMRVGLAFRELDDDSRRALIQFTTVDRGKAHERRTSRRIQTGIPIRLETGQWRTVDLTPAGVGLVADVPIAIGTELDFELDLPRPDERPVTIGGRLIVLDVDPNGDGGHRLGGRFTSLSAEARTALIRYCAIDHRRLDAGETPKPVPVSAPGELRVEPSLGRHRVLEGITGAALALGALTFGLGPASAASVSSSVCVTDSTGSAAAGAEIRWRTGTGDWLPLSTTDGSGCVTGPPSAGPVHIQATRGNIAAVTGQDLGADSTVVFQMVRTAVCVTDSSGGPTAGAEIRYHGSGWNSSGSTDGSGRHEFEHLPSDLIVEVVIGGGRHHQSLAETDQRAIAFSTVELIADVGALVSEIDTGSGWQPFVDGVQVPPGHLAIRLADGSVVKLEALPGNDLDVPSGTTSPIGPLPTCSPPSASATNTTGTSAGTTPTSSSTPPTNGSPTPTGASPTPTSASTTPSSASATPSSASTTSTTSASGTGSNPTSNSGATSPTDGAPASSSSTPQFTDSPGPP